MEGASVFSGGGGAVVFQMGGALFLSGGAPHGGASVLMGDFLKKS